MGSFTCEECYVDFADKPETRWKNQMTRKDIEFVEVRLTLPLSVLNYVQRMYGDSKQWLEYYLVDWIRIDVETKTEEELIEFFKLGPAFKKVLG